MKIGIQTADYNRTSDLASKTLANTEQQDTTVRPGAREIPVELRPVEEPEKIAEHSRLKEDTVELSEAARAAKLGQEALREKLDQAIAEAFQTVDVDLSDHQGIDYSPDALSQRIVDSTISLYGVFIQRNAHVPEDTARNEFASRLRGAVDRGYDNALDSFRSMNMPSEVSQLAEQTKVQLDSRLSDIFSG